MYFAMEYDGIGRSDDDGDTIRTIDNGFVDRNISAVTVSGKKLVAIESQEGETSGLFASSDRGESWSELDPRGLAGVHLHALTGVPSQDRILLAATSRQMYKSLDAGVTWKPLPVRLIVTPPAETGKTTAKPDTTAVRRRTAHTTQRPRAKSIRPARPKIIAKEVSPSDIIALYSLENGTKDLLFAATDLGLLRSDDLGEHWTLPTLTGSTAVSALFLAPVADGRLIVRAGGGLYESKDFGEHWNQLFFPLSMSEVNDVAIPLEQNAPLLVAARTGLYSSSDNGTTWYPNSGNLRASTVNSVTYSPGEPGVAYAVQYGQLYESKDCGSSWSAVPSALHAPHIRQLWMPAQNSDRLYGITNDLGILFRK